MWNIVEGVVVVLMLQPVLAVQASPELMLRTQSSEMGVTQTDQVQAMSVGSDGRMSAVRLHSASMHCKNLATIEGCMCDNRPIGTGITGNFVNDSLSFESFAKLGKTGTLNSFWDYTAFQEGNPVPLRKFQKGKKLTLVANVASA